MNLLRALSYQSRLFAGGVFLLVVVIAVSTAISTALAWPLGPEAVENGRWVATVVPVIVVPPSYGVMAWLINRNQRLVADLARLANHDELTGLLNRRAFIQRAVARLDDPTQPRQVVALGDLDRFKRINDRKGHAAGDAALRHVAALLETHAPPGSLIARLGGEEFVVMFGWTSLPDAQRRVEVMRVAIADCPCPPIAASPADDDGAAAQSAAIPLTMSAGVAIARADDGIDALLARADAALYAAKHHGRNCIRVAA